MAKNKEKVTVEVCSELTGKTVLTFDSDKENARTEGYKRVAQFLGIDKAIASLNYFVNVA